MRTSTQTLSVAAAVAAMLTAGGIALAQNTTPPADTTTPQGTTTPSTTTPSTTPSSTAPSETTPGTATSPSMPSSSAAAPMDSNRPMSSSDGTLEARADRN